MRNNKAIIITVFLGVCILLGAWYFQVFTEYEVPSRMLAAILGVVITAIITQLLLSSQTSKESALRQEQQEWQEKQNEKAEQWRIEHDRSNTVFSEKLKIYKNFLDTLYDAVKDEELTDKEKTELQYKTSLVAMHCEPENILALSEAVKNVITKMCRPDKQKSSNDNVLLETLFDVVEALRKDLYAKDNIKTFSDDVRDQTINNFNDAYSKAKNGNSNAEDDKQHLSVDLNVLSDISCLLKSDQIGLLAGAKSDELKQPEEQKIYDTAAWDKAVKEWQNNGWEVKALESEDCPLLITRNDGNPGRINMGFYRNHYYIQAGYVDDNNFSKCLKWDNGGNRQGDLWYEFPPLSMDVPKGDFIDKFKSSTELQQYIIKRVNYLMEVILKEHRTISWMKAVGEPKDWHLFTWYWATLACEYQNNDEGKVYMDIKPDEKDNSKILVKLGNRANDVGLLKRTLTRIGYEAKIKDIDTKENCYVTIVAIDSPKPNTEDEAKLVAKELKELMIKVISTGNRS